MTAAKDKGSAVQRNSAKWYRDRIWPFATTQGAGNAGRDILNVPVSIEVKARRGFKPLEWMRQVRAAARPEEDEFPPWVIFCPYGLGEDKCADFLVMQRLADHTAMVVELHNLRAIVKALQEGIPHDGVQETKA